MSSEEIKKKKKEGWLDVWFAVEVLAIKEGLADKSLKEHVEKLSNAKDVFVYDKKFLEEKKVEKPLKDVEIGYSAVAEIKLFVKSVFSLINIIFHYIAIVFKFLGNIR